MTVIIAVKVILLMAASAVMCADKPESGLMVIPVLPVLIPSLHEVNFRVSAGHISLPCSLTMPNKNVRFHWNKDGQPLFIDGKYFYMHPDIGDEGTLTIRDPKDSDEGVYQCFATSTEGTASTRLIKLKKTFVEIPKYTLQKHTPEEGKPFQMECSVSKAYPKPEIEWRRQGQDGKLYATIVERALASPEGDLYFTNVTKEDVDKDRKYVCLVVTSPVFSKEVAGEHIIGAVTPPKGPNHGELTPQYLSKDMTVKTGDTFVMLYCIYGGTPMANTDWFKILPNGTRVSLNGESPDRVTRRNGGRRLRINTVLAKDNASYECVANNGVGKPQSHKIKLTVEQTVMFVKRSYPIVLGKLGQDVTIDCQMLAADNVKWTFNGKPYEGKTTKDSLTITKVQKKDNGYYGCTGSNKLGDEYHETLVHVQ